MANAYSLSTGVTPQGVSINDSRRIFNFGDRVSELAPQQSPFFVYLSKVAKSSTDDPVFKFLEQRHQWQRRNFKVSTALSLSQYPSGFPKNLTIGLMALVSPIFPSASMT